MGSPGHSNTVAESSNSLHPMEEYLGVLLCFLHQKHGYSLTWPLSNPAAPHPAEFTSGDPPVASNSLNSTSAYVSCLAQILPEGCSRSVGGQDKHPSNGTSGPQSHEGLYPSSRRELTW